MQGSLNPLQYRFDFLKYRFACLALSVAVLIIGVSFFIFKHGFNYHIDFTGGAELNVSFANPIETSALRSAISHDGWKDAVIQNVGKQGTSFLIRIASTDDGLEGKMQKTFVKNFPTNKATINHIDLIGAEVGKDTKWNAIKAIALSLLVLAIYIALRSEFAFGVGAVLSLIHDILVIMVFILVTSEPISLHILASILAVLGYSLNDTIVIFSKIRENFKKYGGTASAYDIVNLSINQTLTRTTLTSFATLLSVMAILFLGGETLRGLALIMFIGIIVGTFSSIYIASPSMLWATRFTKKNK